MGAAEGRAKRGAAAEGALPADAEGAAALAAERALEDDAGPRQDAEASLEAIAAEADRLSEEELAEVTARVLGAEVVREIPAVDLTAGQGGPVHVVQAAGVGVGFADWVDVATVRAPGRTHRKSIVTAALRAAAANGWRVVLPASVRVLDARSAEEIPVRAADPPPEPELVIG